MHCLSRNNPNQGRCYRTLTPSMSVDNGDYLIFCLDLQPIEAQGFNTLVTQYIRVICRPSDHTMGRPRAEIRTRDGDHTSLIDPITVLIDPST